MHWIGQLISSLKIMKLFGKDSGSQNVGQGTPRGSPDRVIPNISVHLTLCEDPGVLWVTPKQAEEVNDS